MPTYEYACESCGHRWETVQRITEDPIKVCPQCGHQSAKRLISGGNFILKGGGWYADLYSKPSEKASTSGAHTSSNKAPATGGTKSAEPKVASKEADKTKAPAKSSSSDS